MSKTYDIPDAETRRAMFTTYRLTGKSAEDAHKIARNAILAQMRCVVEYDQFIFYRRKDGGNHAIRLSDLRYMPNQTWVTCEAQDIARALVEISAVILNETGEEV